MSIIQHHTTASLSDNWRTINIDALDPETSQNFPVASLLPASSEPAPTAADIRALGAHVRQLLRGGDAEAALRAALEGAPVAAETEEAVKELHLQTVTEVLQAIKAVDMTPMLKRVFASEGGSDVLDALMKYLYKGMAQTSSGGAQVASGPAVGGRGTASAGGGENSGAAMSVLLSWHEKVVEVAGLGCVGRVMSDRRRV